MNELRDRSEKNYSQYITGREESGKCEKEIKQFFKNPQKEKKILEERQYLKN